jgi:hypothetical protein
MASNGLTTPNKDLFILSRRLLPFLSVRIEQPPIEMEESPFFLYEKGYIAGNDL